MTIYIDVVLVENIIMNYIIIFATSVILKIKVKQFRIILASLIGSIYAVLEYMYPIQIYSGIVMKLLLSIIITYIAFNSQTIKKFVHQLIIFYLTTFAFGGTALAMLYFIKPSELFIENGAFQGIYPIKTIFLGGIIGFFIIVIAFKIVKTKISIKDIFYNITIKVNNTYINTKAMVDTGNLLKEPITNTPVIIVEHTLLYEVIPKEILNNLGNILGGDLSLIPENIQNEYISKFRFIPYASLGKQNGMLLGIVADEVKITEDFEEYKTIEKVILGIYDKSLTKRGEYRVLLGIDLI